MYHLDHQSLLHSWRWLGYYPSQKQTKSDLHLLHEKPNKNHSWTCVLVCSFLIRTFYSRGIPTLYGERGTTYLKVPLPPSWPGRGEGYLPWGTPHSDLPWPGRGEGHLPWMGGGGTYLGVPPPLLLTDIHLWKHYLPHPSDAGSNKEALPYKKDIATTFWINCNGILTDHLLKDFSE